MSEANEEPRRALKLLVVHLSKLIDANDDDGPLTSGGQPHEYIYEAISLWLADRYPEMKITSNAVMDVVSYFSSALQSDSDGSLTGSNRNIANVGYYQRGRDYQWEPDDLEPGHWEDHMRPPDWMVGD